jgi:hypothetical protein
VSIRIIQINLVCQLELINHHPGIRKLVLLYDWIDARSDELLVLN